MKRLSMTELTNRIASIYGMAIITKPTSNEISKKLNTIVWEELTSRNSAGKYRYSGYIRGYVSGYQKACYENIMNNHVEFCYAYEGELYSTHKHTMHKSTNELYDQGKGHLLSKCKGDFYWFGTDKPYTE